MGKALIAIGIAILLAGIATRADCDGLTQAECKRVNAIIDGAID